MKRPTWATIVGVLAIVFGVFGILSGAQEMFMPSMLKMQKEMMAGLGKGSITVGKTAPNMAREIEGETRKMDLSQMFETFEKQLEIPDWYNSWAAVIGMVSMAVAALYLLSGVFLLMAKQFAIKVFFVAFSASILWATFQAAIFYQTDTIMLMARVPVSLLSIVLDVILVIVVLVGSKEAFVEQREEI